ncbi:MAG: hypothetical protein ACW964_10280 [Candidatus Hodarchaeales archaeon]|jgi:hypothetical protein
MKKKELNQQYQNLRNDLEKISSAFDVPDELSMIVYTSDWVKFYLVGNVLTKQISIQVEVAYSGISQIDNNKLHLALENQIRYLQYLLKLYANGFTLDIVAEEGIWNAIKNLKSEPTEELRNLLFHFQEQNNRIT